MNHQDLPQRLQDIGGWANPLIVDYMEDYADLLFSLYGNEVGIYINDSVFPQKSIGFSCALAPKIFVHF